LRFVGLHYIIVSQCTVQKIKLRYMSAVCLVAVAVIQFAVVSFIDLNVTLLMPVAQQWIVVCQYCVLLHTLWKIRQWQWW